MEIKDHLLKGPNVKLVKSPNHSGVFKAGDLDTIIMHYTAAPSVKSAINTLTNPKVKASAHLIIGRDGSVIQLIPFNVISWHAGQSSYKGRVGYNNYSIGIEIDNAGPLTPSGDVFRAWFGQTYDKNEVIQARHRNETELKYWHTYTAEQIEVVREICDLLIDEYNLKFILGHEEISPGRKFDPGPAFPLDRFRDGLLKSNRDDDDDDTPLEKRVSASKLNIRVSPDSNAAMAAVPLLQGHKVTVLEQNGEWVKVKTEIEGWVSAKFLSNG
ncbi:MAG TPA: N-acetylmuramoyl-L-alanine amidase [Bacteroidales bacterium]|nr:N-acetylmuramoyl-L-alanine amidase [Bacteroidales bacterium]